MAISSESPVASNPLSNLQGTAGKNNPTAKAPDAGEIESRFLALLVAQLKNQDPTAPMDNAQITSQMAQLNTVSGIQNLNKTVEGLGEVIAAGQFSQAISLLDKTVLLKGDQFTLTDKGAIGQFKADGNVDPTVVQISDKLGNVIREIPKGRVGRGMHEFVWDGRDAAGKAMPLGQYKFEVKGMSAGEEVKLDALTFDQISSVDNNGAKGFSISTATGRNLSLTDVLKVY